MSRPRFWSNDRNDPDTNNENDNHNDITNNQIDNNNPSPGVILCLELEKVADRYDLKEILKK